jgi:phosphate transport system substrate-binding protein
VKSKRLAVAVVVISLLALVAAACGKSGGANKDLVGQINADGSSTVFPIAQAVAEEFGKDAPNVKISVGESGTGGGFKKFCNGETDISDASRPIKDEEKTACSGKSIEYVELKIALDGLSIVVNPSSSFVNCLTTAELKKIWGPGSTIKNWKDVRAGFPDKALTLYGPGTDSGTFDYFTEQINGKTDASRADYTSSEDDNTLVTGVAGDEGGLGYFGFGYYEQNKTKLKILGVDAGTGCVTPSKETINSGTYKPLSRPLFIYVKKTSIARPAVKAYIDFFLDNVTSLVGSVGFVALHDTDLQASEQAWTTAKA